MRKLRIGDAVRVRCANGSIGETLYVIDHIGDRGACTIREIGSRLCAPQPFDTSLLVRGDAGDQRVADIKTGKITAGPKMLAALFRR